MQNALSGTLRKCSRLCSTSPHTAPTSVNTHVNNTHEMVERHILVGHFGIYSGCHKWEGYELLGCLIELR